MTTDQYDNIYPITEGDYQMRMLRAQESQANSLATIAKFLQVYVRMTENKND